MPAYLRLPLSANPDWYRPCPGYKSLQHLQAEMWDRHKRNHPPVAFDPAWMLEPTICKKIASGVELWKWSIDMDKWRLAAEIVWR